MDLSNTDKYYHLKNATFPIINEFNKLEGTGFILKFSNLIFISIL